MKLEYSLILGKTEGKRRRKWQRMRRLRCISDSVDKNLSKLQEILKDREARHAAIHGVTRMGHEGAITNYQYLRVT